MSEDRRGRREEAHVQGSVDLTVIFETARDIIDRVHALLEDVAYGVDIDKELKILDAEHLLRKLKSIIYIPDISMVRVSDERFEILIKLQRKIMKSIDSALMHIRRREIDKAIRQLDTAETNMITYMQAITLLCREAKRRISPKTLLALGADKVEIPEKYRKLPETHQRIIAKIISRGRIRLEDLLRNIEDERSMEEILNAIDDLKRSGILKVIVDSRGDVYYELSD